MIKYKLWKKLIDTFVFRRYFGYYEIHQSNAIAVSRELHSQEYANFHSRTRLCFELRSENTDNWMKSRFDEPSNDSKLIAYE